MKILAMARPDLFTNPAGDTTQFRMTVAHLKELDVDVDVSLDPGISLSGYDIIHVFNVTTAFYAKRLIDRAVMSRKKVALSTIYWDDPIFEASDEIRGHCLSSADLLMPNSIAEKAAIEKKFSPDCDFFVVVNGVDTDYRYIPKDWFNKKYRIKNFLLCVGRIEKRKNQLKLLRAMDGKNIHVVLVGSQVDVKYWEECKRLIEKNNWTHIEDLQGERLYSAYAAAKIHVCVSRYDTPGLVNLEAGMMGCNLVSSGTGSQKEYLRGFPFYCDPDDDESIRLAVYKAHLKEKDSLCSSYITSNFSWKKTAEQTLEAYKTII